MFSSDLNCSTCGCQEIVIFSDGIINEAIEFHDADNYDLMSSESKKYQFWENVTYHEEIAKYNKLSQDNKRRRKKILSVDIHSNKYSSLWEKYDGTYESHRDLNYKDLLGTYQLTSCYEDFSKKISPVYTKVVHDGTTSFLYKKKLGSTWHVMYLYLIV